MHCKIREIYPPRTETRTVDQKAGVGMTLLTFGEEGEADQYFSRRLKKLPPFLYKMHEGL